MIPDLVSQSDLIGVLAALGVAGLMFGAAAVARFAFSLSINYSQQSNRNGLYTQMLSASRGPVVLFLITLGVFLAYLLMTKLTHPSFDFFDGHESWAVKIWFVITIAEVSYLGSQIVLALVGWYANRKPEQTASNLIDRLLAQARWFTPVVIYSIGALMALDIVGIAVTPLIAGLGIGGIAVALALQPTLSNLFSGAFMLTEGELNQGDFIELEGGPSGFVVEVSWRSTKIKDRLGTFIVKHELIKRLHTRFDREGIEINYPVRKLLVPRSDEIVGSSRIPS